MTGHWENGEFVKRDTDRERREANLFVMASNLLRSDGLQSNSDGLQPNKREREIGTELRAWFHIIPACWCHQI